MKLEDSETAQRLKEAFAREAQAVRRYLYFATKADIEGYGEIGAMFRAIAERRAEHAHGHLERCEALGDPIGGLPLGSTRANLTSALATETADRATFYPELARIAHAEGFHDLAAWFEALGRAQHVYAKRLRKVLERLAE